MGLLFGYFEYIDYQEEKEFLSNSISIQGGISRIGVPNPNKFPDKGRELYISYLKPNGNMEEISVTVQSWGGTWSTKYADGQIGDTRYVHVFPNDFTPKYAHPNRRKISDDGSLKAEWVLGEMALPIGLIFFGLVILTMAR